MDELKQTLKTALFLLIAFAFTLILFSIAPKINLKYKKAVEAVQALNRIEYSNEKIRKDYVIRYLPDSILSLKKFIVSEIDRIPNINYAKGFDGHLQAFNLDFFYDPLLDYEVFKPQKMGDVYVSRPIINLLFYSHRLTRSKKP
jgi:hypothetical protein